MNLHSEFFNTVEHFSFDRKMENIPTSEVILASLIRQLGLSDNQSESNVYLSHNLYSSLYHESRSAQIQEICRRELTTPVSSKIFQWKHYAIKKAPCWRCFDIQMFLFEWCRDPDLNWGQLKKIMKKHYLCLVKRGKCLNVVPSKKLPYHFYTSSFLEELFLFLI